MKTISLVVLPGVFSICKLSADSALPAWVKNSPFCSITKTQDELSIVCEAQFVPAEVKQEGPWRAFRVKGTLDFGLTGILASIANPLAESAISIFAVSTFDTDFILVKQSELEKAVRCLKESQFKVE
jgi:hypothetical protein